MHMMFNWRDKMSGIFVLLCIALCPSWSYAQGCAGGQIFTKEAYLYGRFEVAMKSVQGEGVVSSFFLYNLDLDCNWPEENNEIDIEMTGDDENLQFTAHFPYLFSETEIISPDFNPHDSIHRYAIEWEPDTVRWFVEGELVYTQHHNLIPSLTHPMRIMMNLWAAEVNEWVGEWDPSVMPVQSDYAYVKYYAYTPDVGDAGTRDQFSLIWEDFFYFLDESRWNISDFEGFDGNYCTFQSSSIEIEDDQLILKLEPEIENPQPVSVTFKLNTEGEGFEESDWVFLNGSFNDWCGTCEPMQLVDGIWQKTIELLPGKHEYVFTKNFWEENGNPDMGSECDFYPCDEWANYGLTIPHGSPDIALDPVCWDACEDCLMVGIESTYIKRKDQLLYIFDTSGRLIEDPLNFNGMMLLRYSSGRVERRFGKAHF
jgi:beta-glucanase (GH16 family)